MAKFKVKLNRIIYEGSNDFKICSFLAVTNDELDPSKQGELIICKGVMPQMDKKTIYYLSAEEIQDEKYGKQYKIVSIVNDFKMVTKEDQMGFLKEFLTSKQIENLFKMLTATMNDRKKLFSKYDGTYSGLIKGTPIL